MSSRPARSAATHRESSGTGDQTQHPFDRNRCPRSATWQPAEHLRCVDVAPLPVSVAIVQSSHLRSDSRAPPRRPKSALCVDWRLELLSAHT